MDCKFISNYIVEWLKNQLLGSELNGFVVGVSGGIDSAIVSTLCAMTGYPTICVSMPINSPLDNKGDDHIKWLINKYPKNVKGDTLYLSTIFYAFRDTLPEEYQTELAIVNLCSRIRMVILYAISNSKKYLVVGTGNKIEDFGISFFTRYGDGGVDISPIGDLTKTEVYETGKYLNINPSIIEAKPTDGLWEDGRTDEDQIGATYPELEWAMDFSDRLNINSLSELDKIKKYINLSKRQMDVLQIYLDRHKKNEFKMKMPPICLLEKLKK